MPVVFHCPHCGMDGQGSASFVGELVRCPGCQQTFVADPGTAIQTGPTADPPLAAGDVLGPYRLLSKLGEGGMGAVFLAEDTLLGRWVALKVPTTDTDPGTPGWKRFQREARAAAALDHPHICSVYAIAEHAGRPCIALKYVTGRPLSDSIGPDKPWAPGPAAKLLGVVARAMQHAHDRGVIHRDLKPQNIMLTPAGEPVVMDFGLAKSVGGAASVLTHSGQVLGSPAYMPPEQWQASGSVGPAADVYALGVVLFEMLAGRRPYTGNPFEIMMRLVAGPVPSLRAAKPDADPRMEAVCLRAMAKEPADRFPSMAAFADALAETPLDVPPPSSLKETAVPVPAAPPLVVDAAGGGDHLRIADAVAAAAPGAVIRVRPGVYREPVLLDTDISLEGDGDKAAVVIETAVGSAVRVTGGRPLVRNLTLRAAADATGPKHYGVHITAGRPTLSGCVISSGSLACLAVENRGTHPLVTDCDITHASDRSGNGILVRARAGGVFEGCRVRGNFVGVWVYEGGNPVLRGCELTDNEFGARVEDGGRGSFERCLLTGGRIGVDVSDAGDPIVRACVITGTAHGAVCVDSSSKGTFVGNDLRGNPGGVWALETGCEVSRRENAE